MVDVISVLTNQETPRSASTYWAVLKKRLIQEGAQLLTKCKQLKMTASDGRKRSTDVANTEQRQEKLTKTALMTVVIIIDNFKIA